MKYKAIITCVLSAMASLLTSCLDNEPYPVLCPTMGTVADLTGYAIKSDSYGVITPSNPEIVPANDADSVGQRVLININFAEDETNVNGNKVKIYELFKALTKKADDIRTTDGEETEDFGNSPIQIMPTENGAYISEEHLNLGFFIYGHNKDIPHRISLLLMEETKLDDKGLLNVELRHNDFSDKGSTKFWGIVSFTLSSIPECSDPRFNGFKITYYSSESSKTELKVLKPSNERSVSRSMETSEEIDHGHPLLSCELQ